MNTPTIAAVLPATAAHPARSASDTDADADGADFSQVLRHQHEATERQTRATTQTQPSTRPERRSADRGSHGLEHDKNLAESAGEQGLSLPQIALSLAAARTPSDSARTTEAVAASKDSGQIAAEGGRRAPQHATGALPVDPAMLAARAPSHPEGEQAKAADGLAGATANGASPTSQTLLPNPAPALTRAEAPIGRGGPARGAHAGETRHGATKAGEPKATVDLSATITTQPQRQTTTIAEAGPAPAPDAAGPNMLAAQPLNNAPGAAIFATQSAAVGTPLQSPQWPADFGRQVVLLVQNNAGNPAQTAELRLDPPELGPLRITININDNIAHAVFTSAHASVRHAVENALPQLQQQLAQAGISLGQASVSDQGQQQTPSGQAFRTGGQPAGGGTEGQLGSGAESTAARASARNPNALVDTFA